MSRRDDDTPEASQAQRAEVDHFHIKALRATMEDTRREIRSYHAEATKSSAKLDEHIRTCDRRYLEMREASPSHGSSLEPKSSMFSRSWLAKKTIERGIDYVVFAIIMLVVYAIEHGAKLPVLGSGG